MTQLRQWRVESGREPVVRIGVVLAEDAMPSLSLKIPSQAYELRSSDSNGRAISGFELKATLMENGGVAIGGDTNAYWTIAPLASQPPARGDGVLVRDIIAGRGFHWHKRVDQTLSGSLEIHPGDRGLVLVNALPLEHYLAGVITAEMSGRCPVEFLRAQCIAARSWLLALTEAKHAGEPFDRCNDDCCQRYQGTDDLSDVAIEAATSTRGLVLLSADGHVVDANYSKSCGGIVEIPEHIWGIHKAGLAPQVDAPKHSRAHAFLPVTDGNLHEYLTGDWIKSAEIYCSPQVIPEEELGQYLGRVDETARYFRWNVQYTHDELLAMLKSKLPELAEVAQLTNLRVTKRGISGRAIEMQIEGSDREGKIRTINVPDQYRIRQVLHKSFLFSSAFEVEIGRDARGSLQLLTLRGGGWGHGAGLCQIGALGMSLKGIDHRTIVLHYFPDSRLDRIYS